LITRRPRHAENQFGDSNASRAAEPVKSDRLLGTALANKLLETRVSAALSDEIGIGDAPAGITVSAANGRVTLMGVSSRGNLRAKAEKVAFRVAGVCDIDNHISSLPSHGSEF
jgi:osmotically-inducible protein OsmY